MLGTNVETGLSGKEADVRLNKYGLNELDEEEGESIWEKIKEQFNDYLVQLLLVAAVISYLVAYFAENDEDSIPPWVEPLVIFLILIANAVIGVYQDYNAEKAVEALKQLQSEDANVLRDSTWITIKAIELVPGDIVTVTGGNKIPADMRVFKFESVSFKVGQAHITGESKAVSKTISAISESTDILGKKNILFAGSLVEMGRACGIVVKTGMKTELGVISAECKDAKEDTKEEKNPLKEKLDEFSEFLAKAILGVCIVIWVVNFGNFFDPIHGGVVTGCLYYFKVAVALAVAAIPEGLPAVITTCLSLGTRRMTKKNAIIKKLPSVETLGCTTVICSDKTGTLTQNLMSVEKCFSFGQSANSFVETDITDTGYKVAGAKLSNSDLSSNFKSHKNMVKLTEAVMLGNTTTFQYDSDGKLAINGNSTEAAIKIVGEKFGRLMGHGLGNGVSEFNDFLGNEWTNKATLEFSSSRKTMSTLVRHRDSSTNQMMVKGAPEYLLKSCTSVMLKDGTVKSISESEKSAVQEKVKEMASSGLRVLAVSTKLDAGELRDYNGNGHTTHGAHIRLSEEPESYADFEKGSTLLGFVGMKDPVRAEVAESISKCKEAGVVVFMVTGDIVETAVAIGREINLVPSKGDISKYCITGAAFYSMSEAGRVEFCKNALGSGCIFARTTPTHKRMLVKTLKEMGCVVAMTGDGVNDAPALTQADIGIAMGITGTEVAKGAADMILADDNFATIVDAIEEGRAIYDNMKAFIRYMISSNIGEVISIFVSAIIGIPDGFNSIQLLWVNLVTDGLPATALSFNPPDAEIMKKLPRKTDDNIIGGWTLARFLIVGLYIGIATVGVFVYWYCFYDWSGYNHQLVSFNELRNWSECTNWTDFKVRGFMDYDFSKDACQYFLKGKAKASTLSLTVLVMIEMLNSMNAISENMSLLTSGFFANPWLLLAIGSTVLLHCVILYIPFFNRLFSTAPLNFNDWMLVLAWSLPVIFIDEILKFFSRRSNEADLQMRLKEEKKYA